MYINCPNEITKDNVNMRLHISHEPEEEIDGWTFLEEAVYICDYNMVERILALHPCISYTEVVAANDVVPLSMMLEAGANSNCLCKYDGEHIINHGKSMRYKWFFKLLVDYGANTFNMALAHPKKHFDYAKLSERRVAECREVLLTIFYVCSVSKFRALREILLCAARQIWCIKGGDGVGSRGHGWFVKL